MGFKKLNEMQRLKLKLSNKFEYKDYKFQLKLSEAPNVNLQHSFKEITSFKHSGNSGDIIYALPAMFALSKNGKAHLYLKPDAVTQYRKDIKHPLKNVRLTNSIIEMLKPLLLYQPQIEACEVFTNQQIDYDFDLIRSYPHANHGSISRWYFYIFAIYTDLSKPWLTAPKNNAHKDYIIVARSNRYRAPNINYTFLKNYKHVCFVGLEDEFNEMKLQIPGLEYKPVKDFLELATIINSCKLFIGNQSFPFSIAEALKVTRLLELYYQNPNVVVQGSGAFDFYYQLQFEKMVKDLYDCKM